MTDLDHAPLGKHSAYVAEYDPALLFPIPRAGKRAEIGIAPDATLPFHGVDIWNAFELSWLVPSGKPRVALAVFRVPATSPNIVESKSFKLYLNAFNQTRVTGAGELAETLHRDLSAAVGAPVAVELVLPERFAEQRLAELEGECIDKLEIETDTYTPEPGFLAVDERAEPIAETLVSHLLKSNCLVTGQPDWGSVQIRYAGRPIDRAGLLKYLISFRCHSEFHEQCVERIFMDISRRCRPERLSVYARYTRRGGLDINPFRASHADAPQPLNVRSARQ